MEPLGAASLPDAYAELSGMDVEESPATAAEEPLRMGEEEPVVPPWREEPGRGRGHVLVSVFYVGR